MKNERVLGIIQLILVIAVVLVSVGLTQRLKAKKEPAKQKPTATRGIFVTTKEVAPGSYRVHFETTGTIQARSRVGVVPQVSGRVEQVLDSFYAGGHFEAGQTLFRIDPRDYTFQVELREADVARAGTALQLEQAEAEAALAEWRQLNGDKTPPDLVARVPQLAQAHADLKAAKAQLDSARLNLERTTFSLPFKGRVISSDLALGQYVAPGQPYAQVFDVASLEVEASLTQEQLRHLLRSETPEVDIEAEYLGETFHFVGYLIRGAASLDAQTRFATVRFGFRELPGEVVPGVFVTVKVAGERMEGVTEIPASAIQKDGSVWRVTDEQTLSRIKPEILDVGKDTMVVRGIDVPTVIVTSRVSGATEGTKAILNSAAAQEGEGSAQAVGAE